MKPPQAANGQAGENPVLSHLDMMGPFGGLVYAGAGRFCLGSPGSDHAFQLTTPHLVMCGAGSGITPMIQLLRTMMAEWRSQKGSLRVTLLSCNRTEEDILFRQSFEGMAGEFSSF